ncbi:RDD family protein, partial [Actinospica sp.]|uniref:RDD family protein n=1 Tax=Actinospica sp. TaxID=1872142 RepID=UPI002BC17CD0
TPGSRFLGRIIDIGIAAIFSAPITVTLLLIAHRHDHQYVLKLDSQATTTYTTLGMDGIGIAMWAGALLAFLVVSIIYEGYRLGRGGQTFGKRLAGVRVVKLADGNPLGRGGAGIRRALLFWVFAIIPVVDVLTLGGVLWGRPYRQGVHERATSTVTVKV